MTQLEYPGRVPKRPTLQDVADAVGLAPATVSYALRGERGSADTVDRVRAAAADLGYQIDPIASALARGRSRTIAVLCGSTRDLWQQSLVGELSRALNARDRYVVVADADGNPQREEAILRQLLTQRLDGLLVTPLDPMSDIWEQAARTLPVLSLGDRLGHAPSAGAMVFDNPAGVTLVLEHLRALGHRSIAVAVPTRPTTLDRPAELLVAGEARRRGIAITVVHTPPPTADPATTTAHLTEALRAARDGGDPVTAVFCFSDSFAFGALRAARALGLGVPEDLTVVGYENVTLGDLTGPGLTTVDWDDAAVVDAAVAYLLEATRAGASPGVRRFAPRLVVRGSSGPAPG